MRHLLSFLIIILVCSQLCHCTNADEQKKTAKMALKRDISSMLVYDSITSITSSEIIHDSIDTAFALTTEGEKMYPDDPQFPMVKAMIYRYRKMDDSAAIAFAHSYRLYDSLESRSPHICHSLNKAVCALFINGRVAYNKELDEIVSNDSYKQNIPHVEEYVAMFRLLQKEDVDRAFFQTRSWYYLNDTF
ncbi:MAG: hypothetical protein NC206_09855 [Bacteroides sp.]|nr:hypothetical protein [Roseburia sp.]MCM1347374.1 hypothetical protein [Bacteroides sp.]MCM1421863.1 hypothetical protein [Bacteroides sp.]